MKTKNSEPTIDELVEISDDLDYEFRHQAANYSWLSSQWVRAADKTRRLKSQLDFEFARLADQARKAMPDKPTKEKIESWVVQRPEYKKLQAEVFDAQLAEDTLSEGLRALEHKKSALENIAANMRRDWESATREPVVRGVRR